MTTRNNLGVKEVIGFLNTGVDRFNRAALCEWSGREPLDPVDLRWASQSLLDYVRAVGNDDRDLRPDVVLAVEGGGVGACWFRLPPHQVPAYAQARLADRNKRTALDCKRRFFPGAAGNDELVEQVQALYKKPNRELVKMMREAVLLAA
jgi:hypothetical protein